MRRRLATLLLIGFALVTLQGASCPPSNLKTKDRLSRSLQAVDASVHALDQLEVSICLPAPPPKSNTCTANPRLLSDADHQRISQFFVSAYDALERSERAVAAWDPTTPKPTDLPSARIFIEQIRSILAQFPTNAKVSQALSLITTILDQIATLGGGL